MVLASVHKTSYLTTQIPEGRRRFCLLISIIGNDIDNSIDHVLLPFLLVLDVALIIGVIDGKIGVDPYLHIAVLIDADLIFLNEEILGVEEDLAEAFE